MIVKAKGPSGPAKILSDDPKHALGLVKYLRTIGYKAWKRKLSLRTRSSKCPREQTGSKIACVVFIDNIRGVGLTWWTDWASGFGCPGSTRETPTSCHLSAKFR